MRRARCVQDAWLLQEVARLQPLAPVRLLAPSFYAALSASPRAVELVEWLRKILQVSGPVSRKTSSAAESSRPFGLAPLVMVFTQPRLSCVLSSLRPISQ